LWFELYCLYSVIHLAFMHQLPKQKFSNPFHSCVSVATSERALVRLHSSDICLIAILHQLPQTKVLKSIPFLYISYYLRNGAIVRLYSLYFGSASQCFTGKVVHLNLIACSVCVSYHRTLHTISEVYAVRVTTEMAEA